MACVNPKQISLAIIGGGAAGLAVARHALRRSTIFETTVFEQGDRVGGTWIYDPSVSHSSMYESLKTNLPKEVMPFLDFPFPSEYSSFMSHQQVLKYLDDYAKFHNIYPHIKFSSCVETISRNAQNSNWIIKIRNQSEAHHFDAVAVCTGHYSQPYTPTIQDLNKFQGTVTHSHSYKKPQEYAGKTIVCLGAGPSGIDISAEIASVAAHVYLSHSKPIQLNSTTGNLTNVAPIVSADQTGFSLKDGNYISCDGLMFCTGYVYSFPFLTPECEIDVNDHYVYPLYKQIINANQPTMAFIGLQYIVCPFPLSDLQAQFFISALENKIKLPSKSDMVRENDDALASLKQKDPMLKSVHRLGDDQWNYFDDLAQIIQCPKVPPVMEKIYKKVWENRFQVSVIYRNFNYEVLDSENFRQY